MMSAILTADYSDSPKPHPSVHSGSELVEDLLPLGEKVRMRGLVIFILPAIMIITDLAFASNYLFYLEGQSVIGYSTKQKKTIFYSLSQEDVMQKPSVGFDYLRRLSGETRDYGTLAIQARLAYNGEVDKKFEPQLYNAYIKYKTGLADIWLGHNRPALGLSSYLDSHTQLFPTLAMQGFGYERDWGLGLYREFNWGNFALTATAGSGMPLYLKGNYLTATRISKGILAQDNYTFGFSLAYGRTLNTMSYHLMEPDPIQFVMLGGDFTYLWRNVENRFEFFIGEKEERKAYALFGRSEIDLSGEGRLKLGIQPVCWETANTWDYQFYAGISFQITGDIAVRSLYQYVQDTKDQRIVFQIYYYKGL